MGGLYTEASPESLPAGASPLVVNCDFVVGSVTPRPGKQSAFYFDGIFQEKNTNFASTQPDDQLNEVAWDSPENVTADSPGTYASVTLNPPQASIVYSFEGSYTNTHIPGSYVLTVPVTGTYEAGQTIALLLSWNLNREMQVGGDSLGNTYTNLTSLNASGLSAILCECVVTNGGVNPSITINVGSTDDDITGTFIQIAGAGFSGLGTRDQVAQNENFSNPMEIDITTADGANEIIIAFNCAAGGLPTLGVGTGVTLTEIPFTTTQTIMQYGYVTALGTYPLNWTTDLISITYGFALSFPGSAPSGESQPYSQQLEAINFPFSIAPTLVPLGFQVEVYGNQSLSEATGFLTVSLLNPTEDSPTFTAQLPSSDGVPAVFGTPTENWGLALTPATFNDPNFGISIVAQDLSGNTITFNSYSVKLKVWLTPDPPPSFNYLKTFAQTGGEVYTLALGSDGVMYREDVINAEGILESVYTNIEPDSFAQSATQSDREFIAVSDLSMGTDIPLTYTPPNFDRLSQVGPGTPPSVSSTQAGSDIINITQNAAIVPTTDGFVLLSDSPSDHGNFGTPSTPGNVLTFIFKNTHTVPAYLQVGSNIVISGLQTMDGYNLNNGVGTNPAYYTVTSVGAKITGQTYYDAITVTVPFTGYQGGAQLAGATIQATVATMTTSVQIPNLEVGGQFALTGTGGAPPAGYDSTWTVLTTPNASQLQITSTILNNNVATYGYNLVTGVAPVAGEAISVAQTLNGNGIFNIQNGIVTAASAGSFSVQLVSATNFPSSSESGVGIVFGTIFTFDAFAIVGTKTGGSVVTVGVIASGIRKFCYSFLTRNGYLTAPSPIATADIVAGASGIAISNLKVGPPNVIARVIHITPANSDNFFNIPEPVSVVGHTSTVVNSSTYVNDNVTTNVVLSFSDDVLLAANAIDVQGNNLFETAEVGSMLMVIPYASRLFSIGEQNKLTNLLNWSFDGGISVTQGNAGSGTSTGPGGNQTYPAGWALDLVFGGGSAVVTSPIFGSAYQIWNQSGSTQPTYGMITQGAYQDEFMVPIIVASTTYSVRITCDVPTGAAGGDLVVDLYSPALGTSVGTFTLDLTTVGTSMEIFTGTLLTTMLAPVPVDLLLRLYATNIPDGVQINIDRAEVFPTEEPSLTTQVTGSYINNFEAFDQVTGVVGCSIQNQQPVRSAFVLFDTLYIVKSGSIISTNDNGTTEPAGWTTRTVSNAVGASGINMVTTGIDSDDDGEEWAIVGGRPGCYIFNGGQPIKLSEEIQSLWNTINWAFGQTGVIKNDITNRRILIAVPMKTLVTINNKTVQNPWLPAGLITSDANPSTPNVILELNYKQINTGSELSGASEVHRSYSGKLIASEIVRKWSLWTIKAPCAAFLTREDKTAPIFLGNSDHTGKIYELIDGFLEDDGAAFAQIYNTYGFVPSEQGAQGGLGVLRYLCNYMTLLIDGTGSLTITVYPDRLTSPYSHVLLPNMTLPATASGDTELPVNETGNRLFFQFMMNAVGEGYTLERVIAVMRMDPWSPIRGENS